MRFLFGNVAANGTLVPVSVLVKVIGICPLVTQLCDYGLVRCYFGCAVLVAEILVADVASPVFNIAVLGAGRCFFCVMCERSVTCGFGFNGIRACVVFLGFRIADIARYSCSVSYRCGVCTAPILTVKAVLNARERGCDCRCVGVVAVQSNIQRKRIFSRSVAVLLCGYRNDNVKCNILVVLRGDSNLDCRCVADISSVLLFSLKETLPFE